MNSRHGVLVVGGGQAGLAMGYFLARQGRDFKILEERRLVRAGNITSTSDHGRDT